MNFICPPQWLVDLLVNVVAGIFLALLFFLAKERIFALPKIAGLWYFQMKTAESSYHPYIGMKLIYEVMLWNEGTRVYGTAEKIFEDSSTGIRSYTGENRTLAVVEGSITKRVFGRDRLLLHLIEDGHGRRSSALHELIVYGQELKGDFKSLVARQYGSSTWRRERFSELGP